MLKGALQRMARSLERLSFTDEGVFFRSYRLGQHVAGLPKRYPALFLREIELGKLLMGGEAQYSSASYARVTGDLLRPSRPITQSPHVELLKAYRESGESLFLPGRLEATSYYKNAAKCIELYGSHFGAKDPKDIVHKARSFCKLLDREQSNGNGHNAETNGSDSQVVVRRIAFSDCYEILEGEHELALAFVQGAREYECLVQPSAPVLTPIQQMIVDSNWTMGRPEVYQPIAAPELATWPAVRQCSDRLEMMMSWLAARNISSGSYLDICCSYGWFVAEMKRRGFQAFGVDRDTAAVSVGRLAYGLDPTANKITEVITFLDKKEKLFDIVSCFSILHHFVRGHMRCSAADFIRKVDAVTGTVLFLDTGESHEDWFKESLAEWDAEFIKKWLKDNTSFSSVEILGIDSDNVFPYEKQYRRHLFACSREE
jgi:2-polyprenyl-3-methyl-5-hydroxy-6-metoxy-1,4-benzoquinol methylase